jgi:hypothetical protein
MCTIVIAVCRLSSEFHLTYLSLRSELGFLMCMKSKYGPGGEFDPDW